MSEEKIVEFDLSVVSKRLKQNRVAVVIITAVLAVVSVVYTRLQEPIYEAKASIITPVVQSQGPNLFGVAGGGSTLDMFAAMMQSETAIQSVIADTQVSRGRLKDIREIEIDGASNIIRLSIKYTDRELALELAERTIRSLETLDEELRVSKKRRSMESISEALEIKSGELVESEEALRDFREEALADGDLQSVFKLDLRAKEANLNGLTATVNELKGRLAEAVENPEALSLETVPAKSLRSNLVSAQVELSTKQASLAPEHPEIIALNRRISALNQQIKAEIESYLLAVDWGLIGESDPEGLATLETQRVMAESQVSALQQIVSKLPEESLQMRTLTARSDGLQLIVNQLSAQYESAKIEFASDPQSWSVLDAPYSDNEPINKNFIRSGILGTFIGFVLGIFFAMRRKS